MINPSEDPVSKIIVSNLLLIRSKQPCGDKLLVSNIIRIFCNEDGTYQFFSKLEFFPITQSSRQYIISSFEMMNRICSEFHIGF